MRDYVVRLFYTTMAGESAFIRETGIIKAPNGMSAANKAIKKYAYDLDNYKIVFTQVWRVDNETVVYTVWDTVNFNKDQWSISHVPPTAK